MEHDTLVDVGLKWIVTPYVSEGRPSRTIVRARVSTPWWETIVGKLLRETTPTKKDSSSILYSMHGLKGKHLQFPNCHTIIISSLPTCHDSLFNSSDLFMEAYCVL